MAHRIFEHDKQQGLVQAWHGLTEVVPVISLNDNWLRKWDLVPVPLQKRGEETRWSILECSDNGVEIGSPYNPSTFSPVSNTDFLSMVQESISGTQHKIVSVGSVRNRGRVFLSIELIGMESFKAAGRDFGAFLNFGNGHDKSSVLWINTSNVCTVCDNTFSFNLVQVENKESSEELQIKQRHTKNVQLRLPELAKVIDRAIGVQGEFAVALDGLHGISLGVDGARDLFAGFIGRTISDPKKGLSTRSLNTVNRLGTLFQEGRGNRGETLADAFSAVSDYYTHESSNRKGNAPMRQVLSSEYGSANNSKREFFSVITDTDRRFDLRERGEFLLTHTEI